MLPAPPVRGADQSHDCKLSGSSTAVVLNMKLWKSYRLQQQPAASESQHTPTFLQELSLKSHFLQFIVLLVIYTFHHICTDDADTGTLVWLFFCFLGGEGEIAKCPNKVYLKYVHQKREKLNSLGGLPHFPTLYNCFINTGTHWSVILNLSLFYKNTNLLSLLSWKTGTLANIHTWEAANWEFVAFLLEKMSLIK